MIRRHRKTIVTLALAVLLPIVLGARSGASRSTALAKVGLVPFVIGPEAVDGAPARADQDAILHRLADEATASAERSLVRQRVATAVERLPSRTLAAGAVVRTAGAASGPDTGAGGQVTVTGTVRLPLSLPPQLMGSRNWYRHGRFATAEIQVLRADGTLLVREEVTLDRSDVLWFSGAKLRRSRPLDPVLVDFVRKATEQAVKELKQHDLALLSAQKTR